MNVKLFFIVLCASLTKVLFLNAQDQDSISLAKLRYSEVLYNKQQIDSFLNYSIKLESYFDTSYQTFNKYVIHNNQNITDGYAEKGEYKSALSYLDKSNEYIFSFDEVDTFALVKIYKRYPIIYNFLNQKDSISSTIEFMKNFLGDVTQSNQKIQIAYYSCLASSYSFLSDHSNSIFYSEKLLGIIDQNNEKHKNEFVTTNCNLAYFYILAHRYEASEKLYHFMLDYINANPRYTFYKPSIHAGLGICLIQLKKYEESLNQFNLLEEKLIQLNVDNPSSLGDLYDNKGLCYLNMGQLDKAEVFISKGLSMRSMIFEADNELVLRSKINLSKLKIQQNKHQIAGNILNEIRKAKSIEYTNFDHLQKSNDDRIILDIVYSSANNYYEDYKQNQIEIKLDSAIFVYEYLIELLSKTKNKYLSQGSNESLITHYFDVYDELLACYQLKTNGNISSNLNTKIFETIERLKAQLILEYAREDNYTLSNKISDDFLHSKDKLTTKLKALDKKFSLAADAKDSVSINQQAIVIRDSLDEVLKSIKQEYPEHSKYIYDQQVIALSEFQASHLSKGTAAIQYFLNKENLYALVTTLDQSFFITKKNGSDLKEKVAAMRTAMKTGETVVSIKNELSKILIDGIFEYLPIDTDRLLISPYGAISFIPFELLHKNTEDQALIHDYSFSYQNSFTYFDLQKDKRSIAKNNFLGIAPKYEQLQNLAQINSEELFVSLQRDGLFHLPFAKNEVEQIGKLTKGDVLIDQAANKNAFIDQASDYRILHLAMHTLLSNKENQTADLIFSTGNNYVPSESKMSVNEISALDLDCDLVVLSACNTGIGNIKKTTGVESISNALFFAGASSTIMSLWKVPDEATSQIMLELYKGLKLGMKKDEALRKAKINYLANESIPDNLKEPYYWAGFVASGNMTPIRIGPNNMNKFLLIGLGLFLLSLFLYFLAQRQLKEIV